MKSYRLFGDRQLFTPNAQELLPLVTCDELPRVGNTLRFDVDGVTKQWSVTKVVRLISPYKDDIYSESSAEVYVGELF